MKSLFPKYLFLRFFVIQWLSYNALVIGCFLALRSVEIISAQATWNFIFTFVGVSFFLSLVISWRFTRPVHKVLTRAIKIASRRDLKNSEEEEDLLEEEEAEFAELTLALTKIDRKLRQRRAQIENERIESTTFMSAVEEGLLSLDRGGHVRYFNSKFASLFLSSIPQREQLSMSDIIRAPEIIELYRKVLQFGSTDRVQVRLKTLLEERMKDFVVSAAPLMESQSKDVNGVIFVFHDITELKLTEKIRIDFVANASHELRTPLTSIKGYVETLRQDLQTKKDEQSLSFLQIIHRNVDRLIELVNDLLNLTQLETQPELRIEKFHTLSLTESVINDLSPLIKAKDIQLQIQGEHVELFGDQRKIEQVLHNLLNNAIKYIPPGKSIKVKWLKEAQGETLLEVSDNGPGIAPEHHSRLFERFYRVDRARSRDSGGTGLGLAIVKHIMQIHRGTVSVQSQLGEGATFTCRFPPLSEKTI